MKHPSHPATSQTISILTINVWFGLDERGIWRMKPLESAKRREKRYQILIAELRRLQPDFIAVQEANPVRQYSRRLATDLGYDEIHQVYNGGIKLSKLGIPINLRLGLIVLAKKGFHLRSVSARQLSGDLFGIYGDFVCFHFTDSRYVMAGLASIEGKPFYIVHAHTYPGLPESHEILDLLDRQRDEGRISEEEYQTHRSTLRRSVRRQGKEIQKILRFLEETTAGAAAVLLGDFNMTEDNPLMAKLVNEGRLWDTYRIANPKKKGFTWDSQNNENTRFSEITVSRRDDLKRVYQRLRVEYDRISRRIDYIFLNSAFIKEQILDSRVVMERSVDGVHASDHYGVMTVISLRPECERR
ncbi:MAG: hypothetical protein GTO12_00140 [Proteobacteria bacterium]|nr:hypothetical protein [Pseudomonadota bacterium]